jgi:hypothetical protein
MTLKAARRRRHFGGIKNPSVKLGVAALMRKGSMIGGFLSGLLLVLAILALVVWRVRPSPEGERAAPAPAGSQAIAARPGDCDPPTWRAAAAANRASLFGLAWSPFGVAETGWATYAPLVAAEIGAPCAADTAGFARGYAAWQAQNRLPPDGIFKPGDFDLIRNALALRRPFVQQTSKGLCPAPPDEATLAIARPQEGYAGKLVRLRPAALEAYRRMVAAAHADGVAAHPPLLQLISGYRGPAEEAARCASGACDRRSRANCSPHRTGLAIDLFLDPATGFEPTSVAEANRRHMAGTADYRWLVINAGRFGFLPYAYEPWHWEWTGEAPGGGEPTELARARP